VERKAFNLIGFGVAAGLVASQGLVIVVALLLSLPALFGGFSLPAGVTVVLSYAVLYGVYILVLWLFLRKLPVYPLKDGGVSGAGAAGLVLAAAVVGMGLNEFLYVTGSYVHTVFSWMLLGRAVDPSSLFESSSAFSWGQFIAVCVMAPVCEEILFRGLVMKKLLPFGDTCAIAVSGVLFGMFHGNFIQMFYAAAGGLCLGYVYARTGRLSCSMAVHAIINLFSYLGTALSAAGLSDSAAGRILNIVSVATWAGTAALLAAFFRRRVLRPAVCRFVRRPGPRLLFSSAGMLTFAGVTFASSLLTILSMGLLDLVRSWTVWASPVPL